MIGSTAGVGNRGRCSQAFACGVAVAVVALLSAPVGAAATVPGPPSIVSVTPQARAIKVSFKRPAHDGGASISSYRATCTSSNGGATVSQSGGQSTVTVSGLSVGKSYRCVVAARNSVGLGAASKPSAIVVPLANPPKALPVPPKLIYARAEVTSARVAFVAIEASGGTRITRYMASCTSSNGGNPNKQQRSISPITVNHLAAGKTYTCRVASRNPAGWGKFSPPSKPLITLGHAVKPGKPTAVAAKAGVRSVTVSFKQPTSDGGVPMVRYQVTCISKNGGIAAIRNGTKSPVKVANLSGGKTYTCTVAAKNAVGFGRPSAPSHPVVTRSS